MKKPLYILLCFLLVCIGMAGCGKDEKQSGKRIYNIYYSNAEATTIMAVSYEPETKTAEDMINEFLMQMVTPPDVAEAKIAKPEAVSTEKAEMLEHKLILTFSESYREMDPVTEVLCRAAYVRTLTQVPGVEEVEFYIGEQPLTDSDGKEIGPMTAEDFIDDTDTEINAYEEGTLTIYFANKEGTKLVPTTVDAVVGNGVSLEKLVMDKLLKGPGTSNRGAYATIPENTKLISVSSDDGVCYVNLNEEFLKPRPDVTEMVSLYSIVNSLCELPGVSKVQFSINGDTKKTYIEDITFAVPFEKNTELIEVKK